jgi:hypothetical protein
MGTATTFAALIANAESEKVFLAELKLAELITGWTLTPAQTFTYQVSYLNETVTLPDSKTEIIRKALVSLELDGTAFTARANIALVEANAGSYWHDTANALLYIHPPDDGSPNHHTIVGFFWVYFATKGIILNSIYYEPYIADRGIPSLSQSITDIHYGVSEIGAGDLILLNGRGFFDQIANKFIWVNKTCKILLGGDSLAYTEYTAIFTGKITEKIFTSSQLILSLRSNSFSLMRQIPINHYWTSNFPNLDPAMVGMPIPYYYGVYDSNQAPVVACINSAYAISTFQFNICYHAIQAIDDTYVDFGDGAGWQQIAHANVNLSASTFTITSVSFVVGMSRVKVAFHGKTSGGLVLEGAPEIVEDILLNVCGYVSGDLNAASFTASKAASECVLNVPIDSDIAAISVIEKICQSDLAFFDEDAAGLLRYRTWEPAVTGTVPELTSTEILGMPEITDDPDKLYYKVKVGYSYDCANWEYLYKDETDETSGYKYAKKETLLIDTYLRNENDALILAGRLLWISADPSPTIRLDLKIAQITKNTGDKMKITLIRAPFSTVGGYNARLFEIYGKTLSCFPVILTLECRDLLNYGVDVGFWMLDAAPIWAAATTQEKDDSGFWCDTDGYCLTGDDTSLNKSLWW